MKRLLAPFLLLALTCVDFAAVSVATVTPPEPWSSSITIQSPTWRWCARFTITRSSQHSDRSLRQTTEISKSRRRTLRRRFVSAIMAGEYIPGNDLQGARAASILFVSACSGGMTPERKASEFLAQCGDATVADRRRATQGRLEFDHTGVRDFLHAADMRQINDIAAMAAKKKLPGQTRLDFADRQRAEKVVPPVEQISVTPVGANA